MGVFFSGLVVWWCVGQISAFYHMTKGAWRDDE